MIFPLLVSLEFYFDFFYISFSNLVHLIRYLLPGGAILTCSRLQETWSGARKTLSWLRRRAASVTTRRPSWRRTSSGSRWHCSTPSLTTSVNTLLVFRYLSIIVDIFPKQESFSNVIKCKEDKKLWINYGFRKKNTPDL